MPVIEVHRERERPEILRHLDPWGHHRISVWASWMGSGVTTVITENCSLSLAPLVLEQYSNFEL
jgi:hypothetical protein